MMLPVRNPIDEVQALAEVVPLHDTRRFICPKCGGGSNCEKSFCISRSDAGRVFYNCFRAKCAWKGTIIQGVEAGSNISLPFSKRLRTFDRPIEELTIEQIKWYREKFQTSPDNSIYYCPSKDMYAYKIFGPDLQHRGWQLRAYTEHSIIKADNYVHRDEPFISWYFPKEVGFGGVVIVEDIPSARKVASCGVTAVALLGTSLDYERAYEIARYAENFVILALDRGTMQTMISYRQKYGILWGSVEIWQLDEDLKYVERRRIKEALYAGKSDFISVPK